jgi:hypothetical protein
MSLRLNMANHVSTDGVDWEIAAVERLAKEPKPKGKKI